MATDFWSSSHYKRWIVDRDTLRRARADDVQYVDNPEHLAFLNIFFANLIAKLGKKLQLRQRVIATATVFFRRFYLKNSYCETDPFIVAAACCYVAAKAEESPVHIKNVVSEARIVFGDDYGIKSFPSDNSKLAEMEFYLVDELECDLTIFHPYRTLSALVFQRPKNTAKSGVEAGEAIETARSVDDGRLELDDTAFQMAWHIINDTYRSELCLLYPPHLIAVTAIYLALIFHGNTRTALFAANTLTGTSGSGSGSAGSGGGPGSTQQSHPDSRRSSRSASSSSKKLQPQPQDIIGWMAGLNVSMTLVATIAQEMVSLYALWDRYSGDGAGGESAKSAAAAQASARRGAPASAKTGRGGPAGTPDLSNKDDSTQDEVVTPMFLVQLLVRMRELRMVDIAHPASGRPVAVNKMIGRAQAAG
ncbi:cyclin-like protein [Trametes meyenii]|nr:cyclin-like protein [Trametes meyenii]